MGRLRGLEAPIERFRTVGRMSVEARRREQYEFERELAARLLAAPRTSRRGLYAEAYDRLYGAFPELLESSADNRETRMRQADLELTLLEAFLSSERTAVEFGAGDGEVAFRLASRLRRVVAVDASPRWREGLGSAENLELLTTDDWRTPIDGASIDLVYSCHFVEHLHPEDLALHLSEAARLLRPGGACVCITPNRLLGPHDVSRYFDRVASGLHLKEYTHRELAGVMRAAGLSSVDVLRGVGSRPRRLTTRCYLAAEWMTELLPRELRLRLLSSRRLFGAGEPFRPFEQVKLVAWK